MNIKKEKKELKLNELKQNLVFFYNHYNFMILLQNTFFSIFENDNKISERFIDSGIFYFINQYGNFLMEAHVFDVNSKEEIDNVIVIFTDILLNKYKIQIFYHLTEAMIECREKKKKLLNNTIEFLKKYKNSDFYKNLN
jgi:hypothetical protein